MATWCEEQIAVLSSVDDWAFHDIYGRAGLLPPLLPDERVLDVESQRQHFGYDPNCPGDETFFGYLTGDLARELRLLVTEFRGNADEHHVECSQP